MLVSKRLVLAVVALKSVETLFLLLKFISACLQCSLGHSTTRSVTSEKGLGIEVLQPTQTKWHFLSLFSVGGIMPTPG